MVKKRRKEDSQVNALLRFLKEEDGVTAIEYGLIAGLIAVAIIGGATLAGEKLDALFDYVAGKMVTPVG
jgi:pilus assembly protein Flp/PilA